MTFVSDILGTAKDNISGGIAVATAQVLAGDGVGAINTLAGLPANLLSNVKARGSASFGDGFAGINARKDAVQDWCWYCILPDIDGVSLPWYYVTSANTPYRKIVTEAIKRNGHTVNLPDSYEMSGNLQLKLFVDSSSLSYAYAKKWMSKVLADDNPAIAVNQGIWGYPQAFKKSVTIAVMSVDRKDLLLFKYLGCFPSDPQALELGSGSETPLELTLDLPVDDVDLTVMNSLGFIQNLKDQAKGMAMDALDGGAQINLQGFWGSTVFSRLCQRIFGIEHCSDV